MREKWTVDALRKSETPNAQKFPVKLKDFQNRILIPSGNRNVWINNLGHRANIVGSKAQEIIGMSDLDKWKNNLLEMRTRDWECRKLRGSCISTLKLLKVVTGCEMERKTVS